MNVRVYADTEAIGTAGATLFAATVIAKPDCVFGLATGSTPVPTYRKMAELYQAGAVDYSRVTTFNLDEYVGLGHEHDQSYYYFMHDNLFQHINIPEESIHVLSGTADDLEKECADYDAMIDRAGGIDLQILGIAHYGFPPEDPYRGSDRQHHRRQQTVLRRCKGRSPSGADHGNRVDHEGPGHPDYCHRGG